MVSSLIPPKIASPNAIGAAADAVRMQRVVDFYEKLPRGPAPETKYRGLHGWYKSRYFGKNASAMPLVHVIGFMMAIGYAQNYYFHLRNNFLTQAARVLWQSRIATMCEHTTPSQNAIADTSSASQTEPLAIKVNAGPSAGNAVTEGANASSQQMQESGDTAEDPALLDATADLSVGSDNEVGKAGTVDAVKNGAQHNRTNSVKRPATFSKVSISKNFLAKSATAVPVVAKAGDKSAPAIMPAPAALKPRLVAKSAMLTNATRARTGTESSPGPDASTVWNKNRPAPAMPTKQFTDEELKQQYGIHLATRLQTDENGKGSKWADIDDDEDDWAPEAVVWMDGTKSSLTPAETSSTPVIPKPTTPVPTTATDEAKPSIPIVKKLGDLSGAIKTILKPGAAVQAKQLAGQDNAATTIEKHSLKAKSPAPVPSKSPWATLPPVEKVSPVNPPVQIPTRQPAPFVSQDARVTDTASSGSFAAREIAADTFDRSWREGEGERRELFNSSSGKYEPAPEGRRNSIKHDAFGRKPSVLSRGSGYTDNGRTNGMDGGFFSHHRRGSSVSHGSGRRMSYSRGSDSVMSDHQPSTVVGHDMRPTPISAQSPWQQQLPPPPATGEAAEDAVKAQERVMREKIAAARQRRQEEEAREEAAKQERLKAKLDALAGAGQSRKERAQAATETAGEVSDDPPAKTPVETTSPSAAQPHPELSATQQVPAVSPSPLQAELADVSPPAQTQEHLSPSSTSRTTYQSQNSGSYRTTQTSAFSSPGDRDRKMPFGRSPAVAEGFKPWGPSGSSTNVWSTSGIGNGTFEGSSIFAPLATSQLPPPPGIRSSTSSRISPQGFGQAARSPSTQEAQMVDNMTLPTAIGQARNSGLSAQGLGRQQHVPGPIGPPSRAQAQPVGGKPEGVSAWQSAAQRLPTQYRLDSEAANAQRLAENQPIDPKSKAVFKETFRQTGNLPSRLGGARVYEKPEYRIHDAQGTHTVSSITSPTPPNAQTQPSGDVSASPLQHWKESTESAVRLPDGSLNPAHGGRAQQQLPPIAPPSHAAPLPAQSTRKPFFTTAPLAPAPVVSNDSPPPPETASHPVYSGYTRHPHVRLPPPPPVVKLPPRTAFAAAAPILPQRSMQQWSQSGIGQPIVKNGEWQARFNGLFNRQSIQTEVPPSPPRTPPKEYAPVLAVTSSSRPALDDAIIGATVSLPRASPRPTLDNDNSASVVSKERLMFTDELGFGSRPKVCIPRGYQSPGFAIHGAAGEHGSPAAIDAESKRNLPLFHQFYKKPEGYYIKLPGLNRSKFVPGRHPNPHVSKINRPRREIGPKTSNASSPSTGTVSRKPSMPRGESTSNKTSNNSSRHRSGHHKSTVKPSGPVAITQPTS
ncbi:hypothetical protein AMS68_004593 [Peltaster fructicola]|uniref:ATP synthase subunit f, mitochondrial n=1 Tax=Peltaster fructicola TaxID=286661 RepID=A0A6H0XWL6_9PEZI|nr:hypothetical protein AMS68_004593 [Peltaster fructicola]